jgi:hypothetical protein
MDRKEIDFEGVGYALLIQGGVQITWKVENFFTIWATVSFWSRTLPLELSHYTALQSLQPEQIERREENAELIDFCRPIWQFIFLTRGLRVALCSTRHGRLHCVLSRHTPSAHSIGSHPFYKLCHWSTPVVDSAVERGGGEGGPSSVADSDSGPSGVGGNEARSISYHPVRAHV